MKGDGVTKETEPTAKGQGPVPKMKPSQQEAKGFG